MHLVEETFFTINLRRWEAAQTCNELAQLLGDGGGLDIEDYPALNTLFGAMQHIGNVEIGANISQNNEPGDSGLVFEVEEEETP